MSEERDKLMEARCRLMIREPFYGHVAMSMEWIPSQMSWESDETKKRIGIRILSGGRVQALYYPPFVMRKSLKELYGYIQHLIEHLVRMHPLRRHGRDPKKWEVACDMAVNGKKSNPRIGYKDSGQITFPDEGMIWVPDNVPDNLAAEEYFKMLDEQYPDQGPPQQGQGQGQGQGKGQGQKGKGQGQKGKGQGNNEMPDPSNCSDSLDDHSTWLQSDASEDEARQAVKDMCNQASEKCRGQVPGHLKEILEALGKPVVRWRELLRQLIGKHVGNKRLTYARRNRRYDTFGLPGYSHRAAASVSVVVDTSGSVSSEMLKQFFSEIEAICYRAKVNVLQWDHAFQGFHRYRRGDYKRIGVNGRGGTDMAAPVKWLEERKMIGDCCIMLTDGYCNWPDTRKFPMIFCITEDEQRVKGPGWGNEVRMKLV